MMALALSTVPLVAANAVEDGDRIQWGSSDPTNFVLSLYVAVLGRSVADATSPANAPAVAAWTEQVTSDHSSRLLIFNKFVTSDEYIQRYGSTRGDWTLGYKVEGDRVFWSVYRSSNPQYTGHTSGISYGYANALRRYYNLYAGTR